jgi:hypothetical protein
LENIYLSKAGKCWQLIKGVPLSTQSSLQHNMQLAPKIALEFTVFYSMNQTPFLAQNGVKYVLFIIAPYLASELELELVLDLAPEK